MFPTNDPSRKSFRRKLRNNPTRSEVILWAYLKNSQTGYKFRRQFGVGPFIADFCCHSLRIVVELDGGTHDDLKIQQRDRVKEEYLNAKGYLVLRYPDRLVYEDPRSVVDSIVAECRKIIHTTPNPS